MPEAGAVATLHLSNATATPLRIWLEPWVDELWLPSRAELALHTVGQTGASEYPCIEPSEGMLTVWGVGDSTLRVEIDGVAQDTFSAGYPAPDFGPMLNSRKFVQTVFGTFPEARPGGHPTKPAPRRGWLSRLFGS